jgi:hypothetical protein
MRVHEYTSFQTTGELLAAKEVAVTSAEGEGKLQEAVAQLEQEVRAARTARAGPGSCQCR